MIVFDAGVLIAHLEIDDPFHRAAVDFLEENEDSEFAISPLTLAECLVRPAAAATGRRAYHALRRLRLEHRAITHDDALGLAEMRATTGLKMSDALVVFTAEAHGAEVATTDRAVARAAEARGLTTHLLEA